MHPPIRRALSAAFAAAMLLSPLGGAARAAEADAEQLPVPPVPPRIAQGEEYERCLAMISNDPAGARAYADAWEATGGGEGAQHCEALATVADGATAKGAAMLDALAASSKAPELARASLYAQAVQAWLIADDAAHAFASATLALSLSPDDPDLLIDRSITTATMGRYLDSIDDLNRALTLAPNRADALVLRGAAWRHEGKLDRAAADVGRALSLEPQNPEALLERGIIRQRNGDAKGARADWNEAMEVAPGSAAADLAQQNLALLDAGPRTGN